MIILNIRKPLTILNRWETWNWEKYYIESYTTLCSYAKLCTCSHILGYVVFFYVNDTFISLQLYLILIAI